jgi:anthranilate synthase component II
MKILIIDNYDSFTWNLFHMVEALLPADHTIEVKRNDAIELNEVGLFDKIIISPGPGLPKDAGITIGIRQKFYKKKSILGVCLGLQAIVEAFGGKLKNLEKVLHGVKRSANIIHTEDYLFRNCSPEIITGRYHSWVADQATLPCCLEVIAVDNQGEIMALRHKQYDLRAVQFHPESVLTPMGEVILRNWIQGQETFTLPGSFLKVDSLDTV